MVSLSIIVLKFSPTCPGCDNAIPLRWRLGLRKSWGACDYCGVVIIESSLRKVVCAGVFVGAAAFMWFLGRLHGNSPYFYLSVPLLLVVNAMDLGNSAGEILWPVAPPTCRYSS